MASGREVLCYRSVCPLSTSALAWGASGPEQIAAEAGPLTSLGSSNRLGSIYGDRGFLAIPHWILSRRNQGRDCTPATKTFLFQRRRPG